MLGPRVRHSVEVCRALCALAGEYDLWTATGPGERACAQLHASPLPAAERVLVGIAWAVWNGLGGVSFAELAHLESAQLRAISDLLRAISDGAPSAIPDWLDRYGAPAMRPLSGRAR